MQTFWHQTSAQVFRQLASSEKGLSSREARRRLLARQKKERRFPEWLLTVRLFLRQFSSPLVLLLVFAALLSAVMGNYSDSLIIGSILFMTGVMGFWQEFRAGKAAQRLREMMHIHCSVLRDGKARKVPKETVVPGDILLLSAGDVAPGDCLVLEEKDLHANEAALTGEAFPVEKETGVLPENTPLNARKNALFEGSSIISGSGKALVVVTGRETEFGRISAAMEKMEPETAFQTGIRQFGYLLLRMTFVLSAGILILNLFLGKPVGGSILFAIALAVGLAPELLPAIMVTTLSAGALRMARDKVIVKRLDAIQNLGEISILCCDKTGTLSVGTPKVAAALDGRGQASERVRRETWLNAFFESGFSNPLDDAIRQLPGMEAGDCVKKDEVPYDFLRKRLSIVVHENGRDRMITKGALAEVLEVCNWIELNENERVPIADHLDELQGQFEAFSAKGYRTIGLAWKDVTGDPVIDRDDESDMIFLGFMLLEDPAKEGIGDTIENLRKAGITLKIITGDNRLAAAHLANTVGIAASGLLTGADIDRLDDQSLAHRAQKVDLFAEIEPQQKERIIRALRLHGEAVGYMGDGINDAPALKAADVGISVDSAVDVAKEAATIVLLEKDLNVLQKGILDGRKTYLNTLKYIFITTSANFGNMFSLAGISLIIPFLPLLPAQILLLNFISDIPALTIASDRVDEEQLAQPKRWNVALIRRFMVVFGIQSTLFDYLTFACLLWVFKAGEGYFQTGWFVESVLTEILVLLIIRTTHPALQSRPSPWLLYTALVTALLTLGLPYIPLGAKVGLSPLPLPLLGFMIGIAGLYAVMVETSKRRFFRNASY